jgi:flagellar basal body rod protein FlgC
MVSAINTALSGLIAASTELNVSANNIANQFSTKTNNNGQVTNTPYVPQKVDQVTLSTGGVQAVVNNVNPPTVPTINPNNPNGVSQLPNVDTAQELVNQQIASESYQANLKTIQIANQTLQSLLDIKT